jgi:hypothetical protein
MTWMARMGTVLNRGYEYQRWTRTKFKLFGGWFLAAACGSSEGALIPDKEVVRQRFAGPKDKNFQNRLIDMGIILRPRLDRRGRRAHYVVGSRLQF